MQGGGLESPLLLLLRRHVRLGHRLGHAHAEPIDELGVEHRHLVRVRLRLIRVGRTLTPTLD